MMMCMVIMVMMVCTVSGPLVTGTYGIIVEWCGIIDLLIGSWKLEDIRLDLCGVWRVGKSGE